MTGSPRGGAEFHVLQEGSVGERVRSTVVLVLDRDQRIVVDPGMAPSQSAIIGPLADLGFRPADVTDVVISHHHPDALTCGGMPPGLRRTRWGRPPSSSTSTAAGSWRRRR